MCCPMSMWRPSMACTAEALPFLERPDTTPALDGAGIGVRELELVRETLVGTAG